MWKKILIIVGIIILLAVAGYAVWRFLLGHNGQFTTKPKTLAVQATIDKTGEVSDLITPKGGKVELADVDVTYTLNLPEKSLLETQSVTVRKISSLKTPYREWKFIAGAELTPDGLKLGLPGELSITIPKGTSTKGLSGFSFAEGGKDFYLYPVKISDNIATFPLSGFSGYGLINLGGYQANTQPSEISKQAKQLIQKILMDVQKDQFWGTGDLDDDRLNRIGNLLDGWYKIEVSKQLKAAEGGDPAKIDQANFEFLNWMGVVQTFGLTKRFKKEIDAGFDSLAKGIAKAADTSNKACVGQKDPTQVPIMLHLYAAATMVGIDGKNGLDADAIKEKVTKCAQFELRMTSTFESQVDSYPPDIGKYSGTIKLVTDEGLTVSGEGEVKMDSFVQDVGADYQHECTFSAPMVWRVGVPATQIKTVGDKPNVSIIFETLDGEDKDYDWDCSFDNANGMNMKISGSRGTNDDWQLMFEELHEDEGIKYSLLLGNKFLLKDWGIVGKGGVFARKTYKRTKTSTAPLGSTIKDKEDTTFELIHTPQS